MTNEKSKEMIDNVPNGVCGKAYLDIDRIMNVSDLIREAKTTSKNREN